MRVRALKSKHRHHGRYGQNGYHYERHNQHHRHRARYHGRHASLLPRPSGDKLSSARTLQTGEIQEVREPPERLPQASLTAVGMYAIPEARGMEEEGMDLDVMCQPVLQVLQAGGSLHGIKASTR